MSCDPIKLLGKRSTLSLIEVGVRKAKKVSRRWRKISKSRHDLDLDRIMPNVELVRAIFIYYNMFKFQVN